MRAAKRNDPQGHASKYMNLRNITLNDKKQLKIHVIIIF